MAILIASSFFLTGCAAGGAAGGSGSSAVNVGPAMSSSYDKKAVTQTPEATIQKPKLDIIIPVFDPGLPEDPATYKEKGIWPELRRAEATRFAYNLKLAIEKTGKFGAVRVMPNQTATGDLYVIGKINESNGINVDIDVHVYDISGNKWFHKSFEHEVAADFYDNIRNKGKDPYEPVFKKVADKLVENIDDTSAEKLTSIQSITDLRFASNFSEDAFSQYLKVRGSKVSLKGYPSDDDVMLKRVKSIRIRDQLFTDRMQPHYEQFNQKMEDSYALWQKQSASEVLAAKAARNAAIGKAVAGVGLIALSVLSALAGAQSNSSGGTIAGTTGSIVAGSIGMGMIGQSLKMNEESKFHRDALNELGQSIDGEMAPQVIQFEEKTAKLTGSAEEQFAQWRDFLKRMYEQQATPDVQL